MVYKNKNLEVMDSHNNRLFKYKAKQSVHDKRSAKSEQKTNINI